MSNEEFNKLMKRKNEELYKLKLNGEEIGND